jgi:hypothetical protein
VPDIVVNGTSDGVSRDLLTQVGAGVLVGKLVIDVANATTPSSQLHLLASVAVLPSSPILTRIVIEANYYAASRRLDSRRR